MQLSIAMMPVSRSAKNRLVAFHHLKITTIKYIPSVIYSIARLHFWGFSYFVLKFKTYLILEWWQFMWNIIQVQTTQNFAATRKNENINLKYHCSIS